MAKWDEQLTFEEVKVGMSFPNWPFLSQCSVL